MIRSLVFRFLLLPLLFMAATPLLPAAAIDVGDFSFEGNGLAPGGYAYELGPEWTGSGGSSSGNAFEECITGFAADGADHLGMEQGYEVWQDLEISYQSNTRYTLTVAVGNRNAQRTLTGNASEYFLATTAGQILASGSFNASTIGAGTFGDAPALVLDTTGLPAAVGSGIRIMLRSGGAGRSHFDRIRLDAVTTQPTGSAVVSGLDAREITVTAATLAGTVTSVGTGAPSLTVFWGPTDGGLVPAAWANQMTLEGPQSADFALPVTGLARASTHWFTVRAVNESGESWVAPSVSFETMASPAVVESRAATAITGDSAVLGANVIDNGGEDPVVTLHYGAVDGGTDPAAWQGVLNATRGADGYSATASGLLPATTYHFRARAVNGGGGSWAPASSTFTTDATGLAVIENRSAEGITGTTASLRGEVVDSGNATPAVTLFYGTTDGGTNPAAWESSASMGSQTGEFSRFVAGLAPATPYFFRWRAVNASGAAWSEPGAQFTTTPLVPSTAVIHEFHYNPADNTSLEEFIELHNPGDAELDLSGWTLSDAVAFTFPAGTKLAPGQYLVVAENPAVLQSRYSIAGVLGPWTGKLASDGERIDLRDAAGVLRDRVGYQAGFPWPTGADGAGSSVELLHPSLDNDLAGSWRSSGSFAENPVTYIASLASGWKYKKGNAEASSPVEAWRAVAYDDSSWSTGQAAIGYGDSNVVTTLSDMRRTILNAGYASVYFRKSFTVPSGSVPRRLKLRVCIDDGCVVWINGREVARLHVGAGQLANNYLAPANHDNNTWDEVILENADTFLIGGTNVVAVHGFNTSMGSGDFSMDLELQSVPATGSVPTPGKSNTVARTVLSIAPQIRQVNHSPVSPTPGAPVTITAKVTDPDGMGAVNLAWQAVDPGNYIRLSDAAYQTNWTTVAMRDDGTGGDLVAGDSLFTAVLPASVQLHRRLVRYRISFQDARGNSQTVPYADDQQPNFAYFVYGGVPAWTGALRPTAFNGFAATPARTYPSTLLESMPPLHLIANATDVTNCQYNGSFSATRFRGTVVQRGVVHDHIEFRVRGIGSTYQSGKNKWNLYFNRARDYQPYDNLGRPRKERWNNLLLNANASPWAAVHRGSAGIEEAVSHRVFQLAGMAAMHTQFLHLRVIDEAAETSSTDQFTGDLWGLYLGLEPTEGNFLDERGLPDGNIYSIEGGAGDKKHQAAGQPVDSSDWNAFSSAVTTAGQTEAWYRANIDLPALYTFLALNRLIGNVDVRPGDNYRFYRRPTDNRWVIIPYDMDMQFIAAHHWGGSMDGVVVAGAPAVIRAISRHPNLAREYRNRCREILSLMAADGRADGGQIGQLFDEYARIIDPPGETLTWANLDAAMWNLHPRSAGSGGNTGQSSHKGNFFRATYLDGGRGGLGGTVSTGSWVRSLRDTDGDGFSDHDGMTQWFVNYATNTWPGGSWNRKAINGFGTGTDSDPNRQLGYGYKYLEFESLYGGWIDGNNNPSTAAVIDQPNKPVLTYVGKPGFPLTDLSFSSSAFADPQGAATVAAHEWRVAEILAAGMPGHVAGTPFKYEIEPLWTSGETSGAAGTLKLPPGLVDAGRTYRVRVRHKDTTGNWSAWSEPVQFAATRPPGELLHYWNFNEVATLLAPTRGVGGALSAGGTHEGGAGQDFAGENAREGDLAGSHLRVNNPLTPGTSLTFTLPATGFQNLIVSYETRRSTQGAGIQDVSYTLDGVEYLPFSSHVVVDGIPELRILDFRETPGVAGNPRFGIRITFQQGTGGTTGNQRFDNFTVVGDAIPLSGYDAWRASAFSDPAQREDDALSGPLADPSASGVSNLMRYALGIGLGDAASGMLPVLEAGPEGAVYRFRYDATKTDLRWRVLASSDLSDWSQVIHDSAAGSPPSIADGWARVPVPAAGGSGRIFLRLQVTR
jgi:CotH kinase protein/Lamin Tail Domain